MHFHQDKISEFIRFKLNNPYALQEEMRLIQDRLECNRKLEDYAKQMDILKHQLSNSKNMLQALTARREYIVNVAEQQKLQLDVETAQVKQQLESIKREIKEKQNSSEKYVKNFEEFQRTFIIKKQMLVQNHRDKLTKLDEETEELKLKKQTRAAFKEELTYKLKKMRDRERIIGNTVENVESIRSKWKTRYHQLAIAKDEQQKKQKQITDLINYSNSMEKVIYNNLYKRCSNLIAQLKDGLNSLYNQKTVNIGETDWEERVQKQIIKLKTSKDKFVKQLREKREKYEISSGLPQPNPDEYNLIVQTKINPDLLQHIDISMYTLSQQKYKQIQQAQNAQLDRLESEKVQLQAKQKSRMSQIQSLRKRIAALEQQIQIKQKVLMSPSKKKK